MKNLSLTAIFIGLFTIIIFGTAAQAATLTVTKSTNSNDGVCNADCSLREAVDWCGNGVTHREMTWLRRLAQEVPGGNGR